MSYTPVPASESESLRSMVSALRDLPPEVARAIWEGDTDWLYEHYPCRCCCWEHTFGPGCPAYAWGGCRGQNTMTREDERSWVRHYARYHGMTEQEFYGVNND